MDELLRVTDLVKEFPFRAGLFEKSTDANGERRVVHAVDKVSFSIGKGEVLGLAGESGSGKSTTGRLLLRLLEPTAGKVVFEGSDIAHASEEEMRRMRPRMQVIFQDPNGSLSPRMTVGKAVGHPLKIHSDLSREGRREAVLSMMRKVGLDPAEFIYRKYPHQISGGQCQRVVIARALVTRPDFLVADEPIAMADVSVRALIMELLQRLREEMDLTYLLITHDLATAKYLCDRVAVMYLGRIVEIGPKLDIFRRPHHPYTKALLAAVPVPDPDLKRVVPMVRGEIPNAIDPPAGCHFHPRCPYAMPACREARPPERDLGGGHFSACILD